MEVPNSLLHKIFRGLYEIYEHMDHLDPYHVDALLAAHGVMVRGLVDEAGEFRTGSVGVVDAKGNVLHVGTLPRYVPDLVCQLLEWTCSSDLHMLIKSCIFHYEFELIHPFADGNGRMGRLWHTLLLSKWNPLFAWIPVESIIHSRQQEYYNAINNSNVAGESTQFIAFMLSAIKASLMETANVSDETSDALSDKKNARWTMIAEFLQVHTYIMNSDVRKLLHVSAATANRVLALFVAEGKLTKIRLKGHWAYRL